MNATFKSFLVISAKNAINALITNSAFMTFVGDWAQLGTRAGWITVGKLTLSTVLAREAIVWIPKLLAWSTTPETPAVH